MSMANLMLLAVSFGLLLVQGFIGVLLNKPQPPMPQARSMRRPHQIEVFAVIVTLAFMAAAAASTTDSSARTVDAHPSANRPNETMLADAALIDASLVDAMASTTAR